VIVVRRSEFSFAGEIKQVLVSSSRGIVNV
jgi:hypothetical protein